MLKTLFLRAFVFISYASERRPIAERIALSLRGQGFGVFFDKDDLPVGASYDDRIRNAIKSSSAFVFLISPEALQEGRYTLTELKLAREKWPNPSNNVLPVLAAPTDIKSVPEYLKAVTILEPQGNVAAEVGAALEKIRKTVRRTVAIGIACVALIAALATYVVIRQSRGSIDLSVTLHQGSLFLPAEHGAASPLRELSLTTAAAAAEGPAMKVTYSETIEGRLARITYHMPYIDLLHRGGPVHGIANLQSPFEWQFPALSVKVSNNTTQTVVLSSATVEIASSEILTEPIILFQDRSLDNLHIINEGWGDVVDPELEFSVNDVTAGDRVELFAADTNTVKRATFETSDMLRIDPYVPKRLINSDAVAVAGALSYGDPAHRKKLQFDTTVLLDIKARQPVPPSFSYPPAYFEAGKAPATLLVPIAQSLKAGESDNFLITLGTDKSSRTRLALSFKTTAGQTLSGGEFLLDLFVPRTKGAAETSQAKP